MQFGNVARAAASTALAVGALAAAGTTSTQGAVPGNARTAVYGESYDVVVPGGESQYFTVNCGSSLTRVSGWLKDTSEDGKCVRVKVW